MVVMVVVSGDGGNGGDGGNSGDGSVSSDSGERSDSGDLVYTCVEDLSSVA